MTASPETGRHEPLRLADLTGRHVAVWGLGVEGRSAVELLPGLCAPASITTVVDGEQSLDLLDAADFVVASPGVSRHRPEAVRLRRSGRLTGGTALFLAERRGTGVVGVTGSKGKSTTTCLLRDLWAALAGPVELGGNVGRAPLALVLAPAPDRVALEVSSFQAADVEVSPEIGVLTTIAPDHLDWHGSFAAYVTDKLNLFAHGCGAVVVDEQVGDKVIDRLPHAVRTGTAGGWHADHDAGFVLLGRRRVLTLSASPLLGPHNARNLCVVLAVLHVLGLNPAARADEVEAALRQFAPLPFRLELAGTVAGRDVVDDSISSNPSAAVAALATFSDRPVAIILGGDDRRGLAYDDLAAALVARTPWTLAVCTGPAGERLASLLPPDRMLMSTGFDNAVLLASAHCPEGGVILLSPGAPSFNEFPSYRERGARLRSLLGLPPPRPEL